MKPRIGIFTYGNDSHGHFIKRKIEEQHDAWCCLIPCDEIALRGGLSWSSRSESAAFLPTVDGQSVDVRTLNAQWYRRVSVKQTLPDGIEEGHELHICRSVEKA